MNNAFKRTVAGAVLGTTLAFGGAALAAVPANAASTVTLANGSTSDLYEGSTLTPGSYFGHGPAWATSTPVKEASFKITIS